MKISDILREEDNPLAQAAGAPPAQPNPPAAAPGASTPNPTAPTPDGKATIDAAIAASDDLSPEDKQKVAAMMKYESDGTLDVQGTMVPVMKTLSDTLPGLVEFCLDLAAAIEGWKSKPEWATLSPQQQQEALQTAAECKKTADQIKAQIPQLQQQTTQMGALQKDPANPGNYTTPAPVQENAELARWLRIAGLA